mgnify:CR=1 FL=1|jgi:hypothetical protein
MKKARDPPKRGNGSVTQSIKKNRKIAVALAAQRLKNGANAITQPRKLYHLLRLPSSQKPGKEAGFGLVQAINFRI